MKLIITLALSSHARSTPNSSSLPAEVFVCNANQLTFGGNLNGRFVKQDAQTGGVNFYQHESEESLVIYWEPTSSAWIMNRSLGMDFAWYHLPNTDILSPTVSWEVATGASSSIAGGSRTNSIMRVGTTPSCYCAVIFDSDHEDLASGNRFVVVHEGENTNMRKIDGKKWSNKASFVQVQEDCELSAFNKPNFVQLMGKWDMDHVFASKRENNKMSSYQCTCSKGGTDCGGDYFGGAPIGEECQNPKCDRAEFKLIDSWSSTEQNVQHGFVAEVSIPEAEYDEDGWSVVLRFNIDPNNFQGNFQLFNADFFGIFRKPTGVEVAIHQTRRDVTDTTNSHSFTLVAERMPSSSDPDIFFWNRREMSWNCFSPSTNSRTDAFSMAIHENENIDAPIHVGQIGVKRNGNIKVRQ